MAVDQRTFQQALTDFANDVSAGLASVPPPAAEPDFQTELDTLNAIKAQFDAFIASVVPPPPAPTDLPVAG